MAKYIAVKTTEGDVKIRVIAHKGQWALHNKLKHEGCEPELFSTIKNIFTITHIPTGLSVVSKLEGKNTLCYALKYWQKNSVILSTKKTNIFYLNI